MILQPHIDFLPARRLLLPLITTRPARQVAHPSMPHIRPSSSFALLSRQLSHRRPHHVTFRGLASSPQSASQNPLNPDPKEPPQTVDFGFTTLPASLKASRVAQVFTSVASSYDTMNDLMSLGIHRLWKDHFVRALNPGSASPQAPQDGWNILDIAGGTGDIAFRMLEHARAVNKDEKTHVKVMDINPDMLAEGRKRAQSGQWGSWGDRLDFEQGNAEFLSVIPDNSVDLYTVAFGIRNFTDKPKALQEAYRVLKPGGVFACLEFSKVNNALLEQLYKQWSFSAIPLIGQLVAGDRDSYQYLVESIEKFPKQELFGRMIEEAGFRGVRWEDLSLGIASFHQGVKPLEQK